MKKILLTLAAVAVLGGGSLGLVNDTRAMDAVECGPCDPSMCEPCPGCPSE